MPRDVYMRDRLADLQRRINVLSVTMAAFQRQPERRRVTSPIFGFGGNDVKHELLPIVAVHNEHEVAPLSDPPNYLSNLSPVFDSYDKAVCHEQVSQYYPSPSINFDVPPVFDEYKEDETHGVEQIDAEDHSEGIYDFSKDVPPMFDSYGEDNCSYESTIDFDSPPLSKMYDVEEEDFGLLMFDETESCDLLSPFDAFIEVEICILGLHDGDAENNAHQVFVKIPQQDKEMYCSPYYAFDPGKDSEVDFYETTSKFELCIPSAPMGVPQITPCVDIDAPKLLGDGAVYYHKLKDHKTMIPTLLEPHFNPAYGISYPDNPFVNPIIRFPCGMKNWDGDVMGPWHLDDGLNMAEGFRSSLLEYFKRNKATTCFELSEISGHIVEFNADQWSIAWKKKIMIGSTLDDPLFDCYQKLEYSISVLRKNSGDYNMILDYIQQTYEFIKVGNIEYHLFAEHMLVVEPSTIAFLDDEKKWPNMVLLWCGTRITNLLRKLHEISTQWAVIPKVLVGSHDQDQTTRLAYGILYGMLPTCRLMKLYLNFKNTALKLEGQQLKNFYVTLGNRRSLMAQGMSCLFAIKHIYWFGIASILCW